MFLLELKKGSLIWQAPALYHPDEVLCHTAVLLCAFYGFTIALNNAYGHFFHSKTPAVAGDCCLLYGAFCEMCQAVVFK